MKSSLLFLIHSIPFVFSTILPPGILRRDYNPNEYLVLGDCGLDKNPKGESSAFRMVYYANKPPVAGGQSKPGMFMPVAWDGQYPWRSDGISATGNNGDTFTAYIDGTVADWKESMKLAGRAKHSYDSNFFQCWGDHGHLFATIDFGATNCFTTYICAHGENVPRPGAKIDFYAYQDQVKLPNHLSAENVFGNVPFAGTDDGYCKEEENVKLPGSDCTIKFSCGPKDGKKLAQACRSITFVPTKHSKRSLFYRPRL